jgi:hypothetical protein
MVILAVVSAKHLSLPEKEAADSVSDKQFIDEIYRITLFSHSTARVMARKPLQLKILKG